MALTLPPQNLDRTDIIQQMIAHVEDFKAEFPDVNYTALEQEVLEPVIQGKFDPEVQIRGLLRTFQNTDIFKNAFGQIQDPGLQAQINAFIQGSSAADAIAIQTLLPQTSLGGALQSGIPVANLPTIYEDAGQTKTMEVR